MIHNQLSRLYVEVCMWHVVVFKAQRVEVQMHARNSAAMLHSLQFVYYNYILKKEKEREKKKPRNSRALYNCNWGGQKRKTSTHPWQTYAGYGNVYYTHRIPEIANVCEVTVAHGIVVVG